tara:strand:- start:69 stop:947 length:879 start_codon:yes stop_codon:yes gene_type:complete
MAITGEVKESNLLGRYKVLVTDKINNAIQFHDARLPSVDFSYLIDGPASGIADNADLPGTNAIIDASDIYDTLLADLNRYTRVRNISISISITSTGGGGNTPILSQNTQAIAKASEVLQYSTAWVTAVTSAKDAADTAASATILNAFVTTNGTNGPTGTFSFADLLADKANVVTLFNSNVPQSEQTKAATEYNQLRGSSARVQSAFSASGYGILHHKYGFNISSSDVANPTQLATDEVIDDTHLETLMNSLYQAWLTTASDASTANNALGLTGVSICHNSCHSSCHGSRGRR